MNRRIFREYDVRGLHETDLTDPVVTDLGRAFGTYVRRNGGKTVALGRDFRPSSPRLAAFSIASLSANSLSLRARS